MVWLNTSMAPDEIRRAALKELIRTRYKGVARHLALDAGKPDGQINDMISNPPRKSFGEKVARQLEKRLDLPPGYFDRLGHGYDSANPPAAAEPNTTVYSLWPAIVTQIAEIARELPESMQNQLLGQAKMLQSECRVTQANPALRTGQ